MLDLYNVDSFLMLKTCLIYVMLHDRFKDLSVCPIDTCKQRLSESECANWLEKLEILSQNCGHTQNTKIFKETDNYIKMN